MKTCLMKVNYDQKYINPSKSTGGGVRQTLASTRSPEESSLKAYYYAQGQNRLKVFLSGFAKE